MLRNTLFITLLSALFMFNGCGGNSTAASTQTNTEPTSESPTSSETSKTATVASTDTTISVDDKNFTVIDLLVLVDENDADNFNGLNETKIDHLISVTNKIYANSGLEVKFNITKIQAYSIPEDTSDKTLFAIYDNKDITTLKKSLNADLVLIYKKDLNDGYCGVGYVNEGLHKDIGYSLVSLNCGSTTTAHEIGHNMGLTHSALKSPNMGIFDYARGYGVDGEFVTVMSYTSTYHTNNKMFNYSSPELDCNGYECGVNAELENSADAVKALKYATSIVANFR